LGLGLATATAKPSGTLWMASVVEIIMPRCAPACRRVRVGVKVRVRVRVEVRVRVRVLVRVRVRVRGRAKPNP
jgi:hypothetical protein